MVIGDRIAYEISLLPMGIILLLLATPLLLFIGFYIARTIDKKRKMDFDALVASNVETEFDEVADSIQRSSIIVTPHDLFWHTYTTDKDIMRDISNAVLLARRETRNYDGKISYGHFQRHLKNPNSHAIAKTVQTFHIYNDEELRAHLENYEQISM